MAYHFENELDGLKQKLLAMASHAETAVNQAVQALVERNYDLAVQVRENDKILDKFEVEIDDLSIHLLARAPLASDLRLITVGMKVSQNLERVGDEACKIAKCARKLSQEPRLNLVVDIPKLGELALQMLKTAMDAFLSHEPGPARDLIPHDKEVDLLNKKIYRELAQEMIRDPATITRCLNLM